MASSWQGRVVDGRYALEALLGEGGMGVVFRARHQVTGGEAALKLLHPHVAALPDVASRFLAEARAPAAIGHAGIVKVTDAGRTPDGELYLVMELLHGETLRQRLARERPPHDVAFRLMLQVLDALGAAHAAGIVHRDLKPENVFLVAEGGAPKLLDFGIAKVGSRAGGRTATGSVMGTVAYMSPEQLRDTAGVDLRADLWAASVMLYEALTGRRPFDAESESDVVVAILSRPAPPPSHAMSPCAPEVDAFFARAFDRDPARRFASAGEMAAAVMTLAPASARALSATAFGATAFPSAPHVSLPTPSSTMRSAYNPLLAEGAAATNAPAPAPARRVPIAVWVLLGGVAVALVGGVVAIAVIATRPETPPMPTGARHAGPSPSRAPRAGGESDDALCDRACEEIDRCTGVSWTNCRADCGRNAEYKTCLRAMRRGDCRAAATCALGSGCPGGQLPGGHASCKQAAECELACGQHSHGNPIHCGCGCVQQLSPERAIELAANNICVATNCATDCKVPINGLLCGVCIAQHCKAANQACLSH